MSYQVVGRSSFEEVLKTLLAYPVLSADCESTGLRVHHDDRLFSIIIGHEESAYYFNFQAYPGMEADDVLMSHHLDQLKPLFSDPKKLWFYHNAKFDLALLAKEGLEVTGTIHCTLANARVENNDYRDYSLAACLERIGLAKDDAVEKYIEEHKLYEICKFPGKSKKEKVKFYSRVPFDIIFPYGCKDATGTFALGRYQEESIRTQCRDLQPGRLFNLSNVFQNERRLTKTVFRMERVGVRIDKEYTLRAARFEADRAIKAGEAYQKATGRNYKASSKDFQIIFEGEKEKWVNTEKGNPSFESEVLRKFNHPAAKMVLELRDAKSKADFYNGFLYHADGQGNIHPNYHPHGAAHGRFSSSHPNFQNLTSETLSTCRLCKKAYESRVTVCHCGASDFESPEFLTRRAIIPRPGFTFIMPDYDQMEYRLMFDVATFLVMEHMKFLHGDLADKIGELNYGINQEGSQIIREIKGGKDPHQATADLVSQRGTSLTRSRAKNGNFALLYGSGDKRLAETIGGSLEDAKVLRSSIFSIAPELPFLLSAVTSQAEKLKYVSNWFGRMCQFPSRSTSYRAPNYLFAGGCADVVKIAMNRIDDYLQNKTTYMVMNVHDELVFEVPENELSQVPKEIKDIMEGVYPYYYLPLTCGMEWSDISLADKVKGYPT